MGSAAGMPSSAAAEGGGGKRVDGGSDGGLLAIKGGRVRGAGTLGIPRSEGAIEGAGGEGALGQEK